MSAELTLLEGQLTDVRAAIERVLTSGQQYNTLDHSATCADLAALQQRESYLKGEIARETVNPGSGGVPDVAIVVPII